MSYKSRDNSSVTRGLIYLGPRHRPPDFSQVISVATVISDYEFLGLLKIRPLRHPASF